MSNEHVDLQTEQCLLGTMILDSSCIKEVVTIISKDDFFAPLHRTMFQAILDVSSRGEDVDAVAVAHELSGVSRSDGNAGIVSEVVLFVIESVPRGYSHISLALAVHHMAESRRMMYPANAERSEAVRMCLTAVLCSIETLPGRMELVFDSSRVLDRSTPTHARAVYVSLIWALRVALGHCGIGWRAGLDDAARAIWSEPTPQMLDQQIKKLGMTL